MNKKGNYFKRKSNKLSFKPSKPKLIHLISPILHNLLGSQNSIYNSLSLGKSVINFCDVNNLKPLNLQFCQINVGLFIP